MAINGCIMTKGTLMIHHVHGTILRLEIISKGCEGIHHVHQLSTLLSTVGENLNLKLHIKYSATNYSNFLQVIL